MRARGTSTDRDFIGLLLAYAAYPDSTRVDPIIFTFGPRGWHSGRSLSEQGSTQGKSSLELYRYSYYVVLASRA